MNESLCVSDILQLACLAHKKVYCKHRVFPQRFEQKYGQRYGCGHVLAKNIPFLNAKTAKLSSDNLAVLLAMWRRGRDLNSRYRFKPVYSLSSRIGWLFNR